MVSLERGGVVVITLRLQGNPGFGGVTAAVVPGQLGPFRTSIPSFRSRSTFQADVSRQSIPTVQCGPHLAIK